MNAARESKKCRNCGTRPIIAKRLDGTGWRAVAWCPKCEHVAYGGDSFVPLASEFVDLLPIAAVS